MAGIYIHIPYCKQACVYCDFHFSTLGKDKDAMSEAILKEAELRKDYLDGESISSIYFGGGTPSTLAYSEIQRIIERLSNSFRIKDGAEITLEANPDDLDISYLKGLKSTAVNRLSVGIQSFKESDLRFMNRAHTAKEAESSLRLMQELGFDNYSIDLIYGLPGQSANHWQEQMQQLLDFSVPHFSAYALTVEEKTELAFLQASGKVKVEEERAAEHFALLQDFVKIHGYEHYELSNFAKPGQRARHNSSYWDGSTYLGLGPSAHSFNGKQRSWNKANNALYLKALQSGQLIAEQEDLSEKDQYNESLMTSLRLMEGISLATYRTWPNRFQEHWDRESQKLLKLGKLEERDGRWRIPDPWRFYSDGIAADLFYTD